MVKVYKFMMSSGYVGSEREELFEFADDITEEEVQEEWKEWVWASIDGSYHRVDE